MFPKLLTRYLIWELIKVFTVSSAGFVVLMVIIGLAEEGADHGLGPDVVLQLTPYVIPKALMFAMPATCLFSACVVFGRLAAENELVAIESVGLSKSVLVLPALLLAFGVSLFGVWLNDIAYAWSYWGVERVILESSDKIVYGVLKKEGSFNTEHFSIEVDRVDDRRLIHPVITIKNSRRGNARIVAHEASLVSNPEHHSLSFKISNGLVESPQASLKFDDTVTHEIPLKSSAEIEKSINNPSHLYLSQVGQAIESQQGKLNEIRTGNELKRCGQLLTGDWVGLTNPVWDEYEFLENEAQRQLTRLHVVPHRRWANGFSCLAFVVIGIPVAMRMKTANYSTTFGLCFLPILLVYYPLFMLGLEGAKQGNLPAFSAWMGNIACMAVGGFLMWRELKR